MPTGNGGPEESQNCEMVWAGRDTKKKSWRCTIKCGQNGAGRWKINTGVGEPGEAAVLACGSLTCITSLSLIQIQGYLSTSQW